MKNFPRWLMAFVLFAVCIRAQAQTPTSRGTDFWMSFMENLNLQFNEPPKFSFVFDCDVPTTGTITLPATPFVLNFTAVPGQATEIFLPQSVYYSQGSEAVGHFGFHITTDNPVSVTARHYRDYFCESSIVLPTGELGDTYFTMCHRDEWALTAGLSEFVIAATEDNTVVDITTSDYTVGLHTPNIPFTITLNKGENYQVQSYGELAGSYVKARDGKKIAVFSGAKTAMIYCMHNADNHVYDELYPVSSWGSDYLLLSYYAAYRTKYRIMAAYDNTIVYFNCNAPYVLNRGEWVDTLMNVPTHVISTKPVQIGQFKPSEECSGQGDPNLMVVKPYRYCLHKADINTMTDCDPLIAATFSNHYVMVLVQTANASLFLLDNSPVGFSPFPNDNYYSYARINITAGNHTLQSDSGFYAYAYGFGQNDSYTNSLGYDGLWPPEPNGLAMQYTDSLCSGHTVDFSASSAANPVSWTWNFGDGGGASTQNASHIYSSPGFYNASVTTVDAAGCPTTTTAFVPIENCIAAEDCEIFVPNAFSPNADGVNDFLCVYGLCVEKMDFSVYDRWGELVFHSTDPQVCWDGNYKGKPLENAVFAYVLKATRYNGSEFTQSGNVTLTR